MKYLILLIITLVQIFPAQNLEKVTLQLQWYHQFQFAGYYMAKEKGFYNDVGLNVNIRDINFSQSVTDAVINNEAEYATGRTSLVVDRSKGKKVVALAAIFQSSPIVIAVKDDSDIKSLTDFKGKHLVGSGSTLDSVSVRALLNIKEIVLKHDHNKYKKSDIQKMIDGDVDGIAVYSTNEIYTLSQMGAKYRIFNPKEHGFQFYSDILFTSEDEVVLHPQRASAFKKASLKGWEYAFTHIDETVQLILDKYNVQNKTREALTYEAQALKKLAYYKTDTIGKIDNDKIQKIYEIYKKKGLIENSFDLNTFIFQEYNTPAVIFTEEETAYLKQKKAITICGKNDWQPYNDFRTDQPIGIIPDLVKEYEKIIGIPIKYIKTSHWDECLQKTKDKEIDIADQVLISPNTHQHLIPSKTYISDFLVLASKVEKPYIDDISNAGDMNVAFVSKCKNLIHYIKKQYPNLHLVYVKDHNEGLEKVYQGKVDAFIGIFTPTTFTINTEYKKGLKINGRFKKLELKGGFGIRSDEHLLRAIFNKAIDALPSSKKRAIVNNWINIKQKKEFDYISLWKILLAAVILLLIFSYRQFILKRENKRLEEAYKVLQNQKRELKGQKKIYELIFDNAMDGVLILDNGRFTDCNQSIVKMLRCDKKEDLLNVHPAQLSPERQPDGRLSFEKANEMITLAYKNRGHRFEWMHRKATGEDFYCEIVLTPVPLDNREILHVVWRDISERKKLENENAAIRERMEMAFDGSRDGLWDWDLINDTVYFSPRWKEMIGYGEDELENSFDTWQERVHPDDLEQVLKNAQLSLNDETVAYENKHRLRHKDGHWVWIYDRGKVQFNDEGKAIRMIGTHTDLTTEINLTTELKELNQTLEEKIDIVIKDLKKSQQQAKLGSWKHNIADHKLTWSDETYYIFELEKRSEIASYENFLAAIHPDDIEKVKTAYAHSLKTQEPYQIRHRIIMADGRIKYVKEHCETTFDSSGNALVSIGTIQDITKEYLDAEKLREKENMLFKQSRLAQMGEMINMIAHQWRQPLSAISATTNTLILKNERGVYESELFEDRLQKIANYSQHLSTTIDDFRNFFKAHKEKEETTIEVVIKDIVYMIQPLLENNSINIVTDFKYNKKVNIYSNELKQVLLNLIKNAEDVLIENKIVGPEITIRTFNEDDYAVLSIEDNGGGIDNAIIDKIFDPYFSTKLDKEGTGLGLYMSKIIVQEHCAGILTVENDFKGAVFKIKMKGKEILECS